MGHRAGYAGPHQRHALHPARDAHHAEQPGVLGRAVNVQVADFIPVAVEKPPPVVADAGANRQPAQPAVPVSIPGIGAAAPVGVKIQRNRAVAIRPQLVAPTVGRVRRVRIIVMVAQSAAHPRRLYRIRHRVGRLIGHRVRIPVAVQIVPDHIQVGQVINLNQPVIIAVIVNPLRVKLLVGIVVAIVQHGILAGPELPRVGAVGLHIQRGVQVVPVRVYARVPGEHQLGGGFAPAIGSVVGSPSDVLAAGVDIPVGVEQAIAPLQIVGRTDAGIAGHPANPDVGGGRSPDRAGGVALVDEAAV